MAKGKPKFHKLSKQKEENNYIISNTLSYMISSPKNTSCKSAKLVGSSKSIDIFLQPSWGLAPSSYYVPFVPMNVSLSCNRRHYLVIYEQEGI
jgi:hypothetical protein